MSFPDVYSNSRATPPDAHLVETAVRMKMHDDLLAEMPEGARHDSDICPFCVEKASQATTSRIPPGSAGPDVSDQQTTSTEGGANPTMSDISQEAHEALLQKAVADAVKATEQALATKTEELASANAKVTTLEAENADLKSDNSRLNTELDTAQVKLSAATEEVASLKADISKKEEEAQLAEIASKRASEVKNLNLFPDEYVTEKASKWASFDEASWAEQVEEWKRLKPVSAEDAKNTDAASAMTGTSETLTKEQQDTAASSTTKSPRRSVLGLA